MRWAAGGVGSGDAVVGLGVAGGGAAEGGEVGGRRRVGEGGLARAMAQKGQVGLGLGLGGLGGGGIGGVGGGGCWGLLVGERWEGYVRFCECGFIGWLELVGLQEAKLLSFIRRFFPILKSFPLPLRI